MNRVVVGLLTLAMSAASLATDAAPTTIVEPWEPNVTALLEKDQLKWRHLVVTSTPARTDDRLDRTRNGAAPGAGVPGAPTDAARND